MARSRLGNVRLARHDHRRPARRAVRAPVGALDFAAGVLTIRAEHRAERRPDLGEGHEDPPAPPDRPRRPDDFSLLRAYLRHCAARPGAHGVAARETTPSSSPPEPDGGAWPKPDTATQRYQRDVRPARLGHEHPPASPLFGHGADRGGCRRTNGRRTARPQRRRDDDAAGLQRLGGRGRPACRRVARRAHAGTARWHLSSTVAICPSVVEHTRQGPSRQPVRADRGGPAGGDPLWRAGRRRPDTDGQGPGGALHGLSRDGTSGGCAPYAVQGSRRIPWTSRLRGGPLTRAVRARHPPLGHSDGADPRWVRFDGTSGVRFFTRSPHLPSQPMTCEKLGSWPELGASAPAPAHPGTAALRRSKTS